LPKIEAADVGCGDGGYGVKLFQCLSDRLYLHCIDTNPKMLKQLGGYLAQHEIKNFQIREAPAKDLPVEDDSLDCIFTFNAIHHFKLLGFLEEASRVLKNNGYLFIYTRLRSQNSKNIWGKYFPLFNQKETRLYELNELKEILRKISKLKIHSVEYFKYKRVSSLDWLVEQAQNHHYSTFDLYTKGEFTQSLDKFKQNLQLHFKDLKNAKWFDENILLVIRKHVSRPVSLKT
jgi:ubiquinone/menaquinone biosynthesis C-methylase UbiE